MGTFSANCPYCDTQKVAFTTTTEWSTITAGHRAMFICGHCREGVIWEFRPSPHGHTPMNVSGDIGKFNIQVGRQWPQSAETGAPADCPENVSNFFRQGTTSLAAGNYDAAGMMFRKALEAATKRLSPESASFPLVKRIDQLVAGGGMTADLGQWAHEVRLGGNDAAHEEDPFTKEEALLLKDFSENFLRYSFTLPAAVARRAAPNVQQKAA